MSIRSEVTEFVELGPLPPETDDDADLGLYQHRLEKIERPVTDEEAALLVRMFGPDDCYGAAWSLLHLIETAPGGIPLKTEPSSTDNEWLRRLWARSHR